MYLIIREDTQAAERTPPWGAPSIQAYIDRIRANLGALERHRSLKLGYEWSGAELDLLSQDAPDVLATMVSLAAQGRISFYNGTYAQPHLQVLGSESNVRQFEYGAAAYARHGIRVRTYAHQEASVHEQLPQILRAFGIEEAVAPGFLSTLVWLGGGEIVLHGVRGPRVSAANGLLEWEGLDGTRIPLYVHHPIPRDRSFRETLAHENVIGALSVPSLLVDLPDLIEIDEAWLAERADAEIVLLHEAIQARVEAVPTSGRARVRLSTQWSYLEGIRAEELSRSLHRAEHAAVQAEAVEALAWAITPHAPHGTRAIWQAILAAQHHDAFCFSAPELRDKSIHRALRAETEAAEIITLAGEAVASRLGPPAGSQRGLAVLGTMPCANTAICAVDVDGPAWRLTDEHGETVPAARVRDADGHFSLSFLADLSGLGYRTFGLVEDTVGPGAREHAETLTGPFAFENRHYRATVLPDATFSSLLVVATGGDLLDAAEHGGNLLRGTDSAGISLRDESDEMRQSLMAAPIARRGPSRAWEPLSPTSVVRDELGAELTACCSFGPRVQVEVTMRFYDRLPRIDIRHRFRFDEASVGTFFDDESKLTLRWPMSLGAEVTHDIPFGVVGSPWGRSMFPSRWVDVRGDAGSLTFLHRGTPRHWMDGSSLVRLIAWGEDTDAMGNRLGRYRWLKAFDQRLRGVHTVESALVVHPPSRTPAQIIRAAAAYESRPVVIPINANPGALPATLTLLTFLDEGVHATATRILDGVLTCRVYASDGWRGRPSFAADRLRAVGLRALNGGTIDELGSCQIAELTFERDG